MSRARLGNGDLRTFARWAAGEGWRWSHCGSGHLRWDHPEVASPVFTAGSPRSNGTHRERQKLNTALKRARDAAGG